MTLDAETVIRLAPREYRPTIIAGIIAAILVGAYFIFLAGPISALADSVKGNAGAISSQQRLNAQIEQRLSSIEAGQQTTQMQLGDLRGAVDQQADNQKLILQFLLTGQRPKQK